MYSREKLSITNIYFNTDSTALAACIYAQVNMCMCDSRCVLVDACTHVSACKNTSKINLRTPHFLYFLLSFEIPSQFWIRVPLYLDPAPSAQLAGQKSPSSYPVSFLSVGITNASLHLALQSGSSGDWTWVFMLVCWTIYKLSLLPRPHLFLLSQSSMTYRVVEQRMVW